MIQMDGRTKQILDALARGTFDDVLADRVLTTFFAAYGASYTTEARGSIVRDINAPTDEEINNVFAAELWHFCKQIVEGHEIQTARETAAEAARGKVTDDFGGIKPVEPKPVDPKGGDVGEIGEVKL